MHFILGIISRQAAEDLLQEKGPGTFLIRVSERIWGYAISYKGKERCKHFLIDTSDGTYQFFGTNQISHNKLADLVHFHKVRHFWKKKKQSLIWALNFSTHYKHQLCVISEHFEVTDGLSKIYKYCSSLCSAWYFWIVSL